uniref:Uncharacterized protein n=1 Tax=Melopsittacus undulatus TaxID=13146 RepID=A0A8V5H1J0_MELUD
MAAAVALPLLLVLALAAPLGARCPAAPAAQRHVLLARAQQSILAKLRLPGRPNITQPVARGALLTALGRMHVQRTDPVPSGMPQESSLPPLHPRLGLQQYEILSFAESETTSPSRLGLQFQFSRAQDQDVHILQAQLWLYLRVLREPGASLTLRIFLAAGEGDLVGGNRTLLSERQLSVRGSGWHAFTLLPALHSFFGGEQRTLRLELESRGDGGDAAIANASWSHQPFLVAKAKVREPGHHVAKRSLRCSQNSNLCCRKDYYVDFRDIGWNDWIIKPEGYQINYCVGQCPLHVAGSPGMASSFHTAVFNLVKANNVQASGHSCCVPTRRRPLSVLYFDRNSNIVKTDIPDMIVDACGCS